MAATVGTITIIADAVMVVLAVIVVIGMATGAIRLVDGCRPDHLFRIIRVAFGAGEVARMIQRFIAQADVLVDIRDPHIGRMAFVALTTRDEVTRILAGRGVAVMAGRARTQDMHVIHGRDRHPDGRRMAILADVGRQDVRRVLAGRIRAVVTTDAVVGDIDVVEIGRNPCVGRVAIVAVVAAGDVRRVLALGNDAVVAGHAGTDHVGVIDEVRRRKGHVVVTVLADVSRVDMRWMFADFVHAVVATDAVVRDVDVVEIRRNPGGGRVAIVAVVAA